MMGFDIRKPIVVKGWMDTTNGRTLCYTEPRGRKLFNLLRTIKVGAIVLRGHEESRPIFESHVKAVDGVNSFLMDGQGGRFVDHNNEGADALIAYLKKHMLLHTLKDGSHLTLLAEFTEGRDTRKVVDANFGSKLLDALGPPFEVDIADAPKAEPPRHSLLTDVMKAKLRAAGQDAKHPLFKIFNPYGAATWLLYSLEEDNDTLWVVADLGMDCVEYGTASLKELETTRTKPLNLPLERDLHFDGSKLEMSDLLSRSSLRV